MLRTWRWFVLPALLVAVTGVPALAGGSDGPAGAKKKLTIEEQLAQIEAGLKASFKNVRDDQLDLRTKLDVALGKISELNKNVAQLRADVDRLRARPSSPPALYPPADAEAMAEIRTRLANIEAALKR